REVGCDGSIQIRIVTCSDIHELISGQSTIRNRVATTDDYDALVDALHIAAKRRVQTAIHYNNTASGDRGIYATTEDTAINCVDIDRTRGKTCGNCLSKCCAVSGGNAHTTCAVAGTVRRQKGVDVYVVAAQHDIFTSEFSCKNEKLSAAAGIDVSPYVEVTGIITIKVCGEVGEYNEVIRGKNINVT